MPGEAPATAVGLMSAGDHWQTQLWRCYFVGSLLQCSPDASTAVTDASMPEVRIFILLSLGCMQTNGHWSCRGEH
jgi:hypothetical protein